MQAMTGRLGRFVALAALPACLAHADVVYDNTQHPTVDKLGNGLFYRFSHEYGDDINLAPGYRDISRITFEYYGDFDPTKAPGANLTVRLYDNDGAKAIPSLSTSQMPSTLLWESDKVPLLTGYSIITMDVPEVMVRDRLTWTVEFGGLTGAVGNSAGLILADPATVGAPLANGRFGSYWDAWIKADPNNASSWSLINFGFGANDPKANFFVRVEAIPEPGTWALLAGGAGLLLAFGRRAKH